MPFTHTVGPLQHAVFSRYRTPPRLKSFFVRWRREKSVLLIAGFVAAVAKRHKTLAHYPTSHEHQEQDQHEKTQHQQSSKRTCSTLPMRRERVFCGGGRTGTGLSLARHLSALRRRSTQSVSPHKALSPRRSLTVLTLLSSESGYLEKIRCSV